MPGAAHARAARSTPRRVFFCVWRLTNRIASPCIMSNPGSAAALTRGRRQSCAKSSESRRRREGREGREARDRRQAHARHPQGQGSSPSPGQGRRQNEAVGPRAWPATRHDVPRMCSGNPRRLAAFLASPGSGGRCRHRDLLRVHRLRDLDVCLRAGGVRPAAPVRRVHLAARMGGARRPPCVPRAGGPVMSGPHGRPAAAPP